MNGYWLTEFIKVFLGYIFLMFVWPAAVFGGLLKGKPKTFRFGLYVTVQPILLSAFVLAAGFLGILSTRLFNIVAYGAFLVCILVRFVRYGRRKGFLDEEGTFSPGRLDRYTLRRTASGGKRVFSGIREMLSGHRAEYFMLVVMLAYGILYFSYGALQDHSYGFGDMYVHTSIINALSDGNVFSEGLYPLGMHGFVFGIHALFGIEVYSVMLFTAGIHSMVFLLSAYILLKELFRSRYAALLSILLFLTIDTASDIGVYGMSRLQYTIPMEFGLYTVFLCPAFLLRYLHSPEKKERSHVWNGELLLFGLSVAAAFAIHYYAVIMAFFLCAVVGLASFRKTFSMNRFVPLISVALIGAVFGGIFLLAGGLNGISVQGSMEWAINIIRGQASEFDPDMSIVKVQDALAARWRTEGVLGKIALFWQCSYGELFGQLRGAVIAALTLATFAVWAFLKRISMYNPVYVQYCKKMEKYCMLALCSLLYVLLYGAAVLKLFALVSGPRLFCVMQLLSMAVLMMPFDLLFSYYSTGRHAAAGYLPMAFLSACVWFVALEFIMGNYHGYLYYELTQYNAAVECTESLIKVLPANGYTVVAPTDVLHQVRHFGRHEELLTFVEKAYGEESYTLPTERIFVYVEKKPIVYAQSHFFTGPVWLALDKYADSYTLFDMPVSRCPEIAQETVIEDADPENLEYRAFDTYKDTENRVLLESLAYKWARNFRALYPKEMTVYYEDENFACYEIRQNGQAKLELTAGALP